MVTVDGEHHILSITSENVEDDISRARSKLHTLSMEDLVSKLSIRDHN